MRSSEIKRKMSRLAYSACALFCAGGVLVSCEDELLTGTPSWLGSSIYAELQSRGNFQTTLKLIDDPAILQHDVLSLTGSKTLFVANDDAYSRFFSNNSWGVRSFEDLSDSQKRLLFKSSMVNSAYLIELMSSISNGTSDPTPGMCMRRETALSLYDTIPMLRAEDMPDNTYWAYYREKYPEGGQNGMLVMRDDNTAPMVHFLPAFMSNNSITDDDLSFLTNGACDNTSESYINGQRLTEADVTCQNGYIQVVENVMDPLTNMAEVIRKDTSLSMFSKLLDRFCVPVYSASQTSAYNAYNTSGQVDSVFVWRYANSGFDGAHAKSALTSYKNRDFTDLLPYDPGWNTYLNAPGGKSMAADMAVIIAPTNDAFKRYFSPDGDGQLLYTRYGTLDAVPDNIIAAMLENFMKTSLVATVPSKFRTVVNTAQMDMGLDVDEEGGEKGVYSCLMANNGVVYKSNKVFTVPEYQSVSFPAELDDHCLIMRKMIEELNYDGYFNTMYSEYMFILPTDEALANYVDPVDYQKTTPTITEFYIEDDVVHARRYNATKNADGSLTRGLPIRDPWSVIDEEDYINNRMRDILENSILVKDDRASAMSGKTVWTSKGGCPLILEGAEEDMTFITPYNRELAGNDINSAKPLTVRQEEGYFNMGSNPDGNGETFIVESEPVMPATKSVLQMLEDLAATNPEYEGFYELISASSLVSETFDGITSSGNTSYKTTSNGPTLSIMSNFNYTVYVPPTSELNKMYDAGLLPSPQAIEEVENMLDDPGLSDADLALYQQRLENMQDSVDNFIRYHVQNNAVYMTAPSTGTYETSYLYGGRFMTLAVENSGSTSGDISVRCMDPVTGEAITGSVVRHVTDGNYFAREYHYRRYVSASESSQDGPYGECATLTSANYLYNSATAVIHLIDKPLLYSEDMWEDYAEIE